MGDTVTSDAEITRAKHIARLITSTHDGGYSVIADAHELGATSTMSAVDIIEDIEDVLVDLEASAKP